MTQIEFRAFLDLLMVSDPWPLDDHSHQQLQAFANREAKKHGYEDWIEAYHYVAPQEQAS